MTSGPVVKPGWLRDASPRITRALSNWESGIYPRGIEAFLVATPLKHALRGVYGKGNVGLAVILLKEAIAEKLRFWFWYWEWKLAGKPDGQD